MPFIEKIIDKEELLYTLSDRFSGIFPALALAEIYDEDDREEEKAIPLAPVTRREINQALLAFGLLLLPAALLLIVAAVRQFVDGAAAGPMDIWARYLEDAGLYALGMIGGCALATGYLVFGLRHEGADGIAVRLGLRPAPWGLLALCLFVAAIWVFTGDALSYLYDRQVVPDFRLAQYSQPGAALAFWIALALILPIFEELFFRGYLIDLLRRSPLGLTGAILASAALFAISYFQFGVLAIALVFVFGIFLAAVRLLGQSLLPSLVMHIAAKLLIVTELSFAAGL
jgi:membrane protease YdiL (CAAX protease family)